MHRCLCMVACTLPRHVDTVVPVVVSRCDGLLNRWSLAIVCSCFSDIKNKLANETKPAIDEQVDDSTSEIRKVILLSDTTIPVKYYVCVEVYREVVKGVSFIEECVYGWYIFFTRTSLSLILSCNFVTGRSLSLSPGWPILARCWVGVGGFLLME